MGRPHIGDVRDRMKQATEHIREDERMEFGRADLTTIDTASVDAALTTTRAVRRRLDLTRPVADQIIFDCIDVAEQAPTGGNQGSRRWVIVRDPEIKAQLAELYLASAGEWMISARDRLAGSGHPQERVMASAAHLAEHLADVPAIVVPTIIGVHDGSGQPGLFDSVIQAVWSFCVALRARGLGSAWTTAVLTRRAELADLLGIPDGNTPVAMLPVAWTTGTDFGPAPRLPARQVAFVDRYGITWETGPSDPPRLADGPGAVAEADIAASVRDVWALVTDINVGAEFSREFVGARWADGVDGPSLGARFIGSNSNSAIGEWEVDCWVDRFDPPHEFGWATTDPDDPGARWAFTIADVVGATRLRHSVVLGTGPSGLSAYVAREPAQAASAIAGRLGNLRGNMQRVVDGIKSRAESPPAPL